MAALSQSPTAQLALSIDARHRQPTGPRTSDSPYLGITTPPRPVDQDTPSPAAGYPTASPPQPVATSFARIRSPSTHRQDLPTSRCLRAESCPCGWRDDSIGLRGRRYDASDCPGLRDHPGFDYGERAEIPPTSPHPPGAKPPSRARRPEGTYRMRGSATIPGARLARNPRLVRETCPDRDRRARTMAHDVQRCRIHGHRFSGDPSPA